MVGILTVGNHEKEVSIAFVCFSLMHVFCRLVICTAARMTIH